MELTVGSGVQAAESYLLERMSFLASAVAGRPIDVLCSTKGPTRTDGTTIFIDNTTDPRQARKQVLVQSALLAGGMTAERVKSLRSRRDGLRRYFLLEVVRVASLPSPEGRIIRAGVDDLPNDVIAPQDADDAVCRAAGGEKLPPTPPSWGLIDARLLGSGAAKLEAAARRSTPAAPRDAPAEEDELEDEDSESSSRIAKLFSSPLGGGALGRLFQKLAGAGHAESSGDPDGAEASSKATTTNWSPTDASRPRGNWLAGRARVPDPPGVSKLSYPEWDFATQTYKPDWCHVTAVSLRDASEALNTDRDDSGPALAAAPSRPLLKALLPIGLSTTRVGRLVDGRELDLDAVVDALSDPGANQDAIYSELLPRRRELGVLVLLDCSGSTRDRSRAGGTIFGRQLQAASAILDVMTSLGCRTSALAFQSLGRRSVRLIDLKAFHERAGAELHRRLKLINPGAYTRIGAAIRHGTHLLKTESGARRGLLVVITDGFPYDMDYTAAYAQADTAHALAEARASGIGCVCLSVGSNEPDDDLARVFGSTTTAILSEASELAPVARRLFADALMCADLRRRLN